MKFYKFPFRHKKLKRSLSWVKGQKHKKLYANPIFTSEIEILKLKKEMLKFKLASSLRNSNSRNFQSFHIQPFIEASFAYTLLNRNQNVIKTNFLRFCHRNNVWKQNLKTARDKYAELWWSQRLFSAIHRSWRNKAMKVNEKLFELLRSLLRYPLKLNEKRNLVNFWGLLRSAGVHRHQKQQMK